jgi:hypothetical protein
LSSSPSGEANPVTSIDLIAIFGLIGYFFSPESKLAIRQNCH